MKVSSKVKAIAGLLALVASGSAFASTNLDVTNGSFFLDVYDTANGNSYVLDTGLLQSTFNGSGSYKYSFGSDPIYQSFLSAAGSDFLLYDVVSAANGSTTPIYSTAASFSGTALQSNVSGIVSIATGYMTAVNSWTGQSSTTSAFVNVPTDPAGFATFESSLSGKLAINDLAAPGTALAFYSWIGGRSASTPAALTTYAGTWLLNGSTLTYGSAVAAVPLPASWGLLLGGLALMGIIARRGKSSSGDNFSGFAA